MRNKVYILHKKLGSVTLNSLIHTQITKRISSSDRSAYFSRGGKCMATASCCCYWTSTYENTNESGFYRPGTDLISLLILCLLFFFLMLPRFKSYNNEICQKCSSQKYASTNGVDFSIWSHNFKSGGHDVISRRKSAAARWVKTKRVLRAIYAAAHASSWSIVRPYLLAESSGRLADSWAICVLRQLLLWRRLNLVLGNRHETG